MTQKRFSVLSIPGKNGPSLSLSAKICLAAISLAVLGLATTASFIGFKSSDAAGQAAMQLAQTSAREAASAVSGRIKVNLAGVQSLEGVMTETKRASMPLQREQIDEMVKSTLKHHSDFVGAAVTWEPDALDGNDSAYAGKSPGYDASGRHMPYWTRSADGRFHVDPIVFDPAPGANDWYDIPKKSGKIHFTEPYEYPIEGKPVLMASLVAPILLDGRFLGTASADFTLDHLSASLGELKGIDQGTFSLVSNTGLYAAHPHADRIGKLADDIPAEALAAIARGEPHQYTDNKSMVHLFQPMRVHPDALPWSVRTSFPKSVTEAASRELAWYALAVGVACALAISAVLWVVVSRLMKPLRALSGAMSNLSSGEADLSTRLDVVGRDELAAIGAGFNAFVHKLQTVMLTVRENAEGVANASSEIAQGNNDLSARTESQASALEQTAASMNHLNSTVMRNAGNANQANELALNASQIAVQGGQVVSQVIDTMKGINAASQKISDIIGVIDGIAFQTNILALNAAVEAARAGEQGRGFAVVASEVRSLASQSAEAAKEIKSLIGSSVERVEQGSVLVDKAGATMAQVVSSIQQVTTLMGEISIDSQSQSTGFAEMGKAVSEMDQTTQQNAAMVEEMASAASGLKMQARDLVEAVGSFKI